MGQAILPKLLRCIEETYPVTIMMQLIKHRIPNRKGLRFSAETSARCPLAGTALVTILSAESAAIYNFPDARYFKALFALTRFGIGFAKSERSRKG